MLRLIIAAMLLAVGLVAATWGRHTVLGIEADVVSAYARLPRRLADGLTGVAWIVAGALPLVALVLLLVRRRFQAAAALVVGSIVAGLVMVALDGLLNDRSVIKAVETELGHPIQLNANGFATSQLLASVIAMAVIGFLILMRAVRFRRAVARPFGLILAVTTVFAVARLAEPRQGSLIPTSAVVVGFVVLSVLCVGVGWLLFKSSAVDEHLSARPVRRHVPGWVLTARIAVLSYGALTLVPFLVAVGTVFGDRRLPLAVIMPLLGAWFALFLVLGFVLPFGSFFIVLGKTWARWLVGTLSVVVLVVQPLLCLAFLGGDGLLRDGAPMIVTAVLGLYALHRSRGQETWVRPNPGTPPVRNQAKSTP